MAGNVNEKKINLKQTFDNFNKEGNVPKTGYSKEHISKGAGKIKILLEIIESAKQDTIKKGQEIFDNFNVSFEFSSVDSKPFGAALSAIGFTEISDAQNQTLDVSINFNYSELAKYSDVEVYAIVSSLMYDSLLKKRDIAVSGKEVKFGKNLSEYSNNIESQDNFEPSVFEYIKEFIKLFFDGNQNFGDMNYSACAKWVSKNLKQNGIMAENIFDNPNGKNLFAERFAKVSKLGYQQQATALAGVFSKKDLGSLQTKNDAEIKAFCEKFSNQFLQNSGLSTDSYSIEIDSKEGGDLGNYVDMGANGQKIVINVSEIRKLDNPAELIMTLAHELTHMVDSSINKADGKMSRKGYGLSEHNIVGSVNKNAPDFVRKMEQVYYDVNPHERSARQGELVALEFMMQMQPDETMKKYINKSLKDFQAYQKNTLKSLQTRVDELFAEYNNSINSFGYDAETMAYIDKVMADLNKMKEEGLLDIANDLRALQESESVKNRNREEVQASELGE